MSDFAWKVGDRVQFLTDDDPRTAIHDLDGTKGTVVAAGGRLDDVRVKSDFLCGDEVLIDPFALRPAP